MNDIQINGVSIGIRMVSWAPFERAVSYANIAVQGFTDTFMSLQMQWPIISDAMFESLVNYRSNDGLAFTGKKMRYHIRSAERLIIKQRRLDRRNKFPSFFRLEGGGT